MAKDVVGSSDNNNGLIRQRTAGTTASASAVVTGVGVANRKVPSFFPDPPQRPRRAGGRLPLKLPPPVSALLLVASVAAALLVPFCWVFLDREQGWDNGGAGGSLAALSHRSLPGWSSSLSAGGGGGGVEADPIDWRPNDSTLALLYPPGLLGGYRNQFIRFTSLAAYAVRNNLTHLFLPSLLWSTTVSIDGNDGSDGNNESSSSSSRTLTIPMEYIFDIGAWNRYVLEDRHNQLQEKQTDEEGRRLGRRVLPVIVRDVNQPDCWVPWNRTDYYREHLSRRVAGAGTDPSLRLHPLQRASLEMGTIGAISNLTQQLIVEQNVRDEDRTLHARRMDLLEVAQRQCHHPVPYGGGIMGGRLWNDHVNKYTDGGHSKYPHEVDRHVLQGLRPLEKWRRVPRDYCFGGGGSQTDDKKGRGKNYLALHARVELEMLAHPCGREMEKNLTRIFERTSHFLDWANGQNDNADVDMVFVAVWRQGIQDPKFLPKWETWANHNIRALNRYTTASGAAQELLGDRYAVVECGTQMMDRYYADHPTTQELGTLLEQAINFDLAVQATYFVGVAGSSYSNDVWRTRYYLGKGSQNFRYTRDAIEPVENDGLPNPHGNCKQRKGKS